MKNNMNAVLENTEILVNITMGKAITDYLYKDHEIFFFLLL